MLACFEKLDFILQLAIIIFERDHLDGDDLIAIMMHRLEHLANGALAEHLEQGEKRSRRGVGRSR
jgi:hypothetical protein